MTDAAIRVSLRLNGRSLQRDVAPNLLLADLLREGEGLSGTKIGCDQGVCGACTVLADGRPLAACTTFAWQAEGRDITTIEGLAQGGTLHPVQAAFKERSAFQCGYCTPGMILLAAALLKSNPAPSRAEVTAWMSANICRCTGYLTVVEAVEDAARRARAGRP